MLLHIFDLYQNIFNSPYSENFYLFINLFLYLFNNNI